MADPKVDPNVLGLSIELQMNTMIAEKALGSLSSDVLKLSGNIDKQLNAALNSTKTNFDAITASSEIIKTNFDNISSSALSFADAVSETAKGNTDLSNTFSNIDAAYVKIAGNFATIEKKTSGISVNVKAFSDGLNTAVAGSQALTDINNSLDKFIKNAETLKTDSALMFDGFKEFVKEFEKYDDKDFKPYKENIDKINIATKETYESYKNMAAEMMSIRSLTDEVATATGGGSTLISQELKDFRDITLAVNAISAALVVKNSHHAAEASLVKDESAEVARLKAKVGELEETIKKNAAASRNLAFIWRMITTEAKKIDDVAANFRESNNRSVGSMYELASISAKVSVNTGIAAAETAKMVKELISVKTGKDDLITLATTMVKLEKMTGLSGKALAGASRTMKNMGYTAQETEKTMLGFADSMAKMGIEGGDVQVILDNMQERALLFGNTLDKKLTASINRATAAQLAMAKALGVSSDEVKKMNSNTMDDIIMLEALSGVAIDTEEDMKTAQLAMAASIAQEFEDTGGNYRDIIQLQSRLKSQGFTDGQIAMYKNMGKEMKRLGIDPEAVDAQEQFNKAMESSKSAGDKFHQSMDTLTDQLGTLLNTGASLMMMFVKPFMVAVTNILYVVNGLIFIIMVACDAIAAFSAEIEKVFPPWSWFITILSWATSAIMVIAAGATIMLGVVVALIQPIISLVVAMYTAGTTAGFFGAAVQSATTWIMSSITSLTSSLSTMMTSLATSIGAAFESFVGYLARGLDKLTDVASKAAWPVLQLAVALLIMSAALYIMAQALSVVAAIDFWKMVGGLAAFLILIAAFTYALTFILPLLAAAGPFLLAFAGVVLAFGAAALMAAVGIYIMAMAFALVASVLTPTLALSVALLAVSLYLLIAAIVLFMPVAVPFGVTLGVLSSVFFIFAVACVVLGAAVAFLAIGLYLISQSMTPGIATQMQEFGVGLWEFCKAVGIVGTAALAAIGVAMIPLAIGMLFLAAAFALAGNIGGQFTALAAGISTLASIDAGAIGTLAKLGLPLAEFSHGVAAIARAFSVAGPNFAANFSSVAYGVSALLKAIAAVDPAAIGLLSSLAQPLQEFGAGVAGLVASMSGIDPTALAAFATTATTIATSINALASIDMAKVTALGGIAAPLEAFSQAIQSLSDTFISLDLAFLDTAKLAVAGLKEVAVILESAAAPLVAGAFGLLIGAMVLNSAVAAITSGIDALATAVTSLASISPILLQSSGEILTSGNNLWYGAFALLRGAYLLLSTAPILISASTMISASSGVLLQASFVLMIFANGLMVAGTSAMEGATALFTASGLLRDASAILLTTGPELLTAMVQLQAAIPIISSIAYGMMAAGAVLYSGAMSIYFASMFLGVAVTKIAEYAQTLNDFADPLDRLAASFGSLAASMMLIKDAVSGLSALPLAAIIESFQKFSPTDEALEKVKNLSLALEKIGIEYSKAISDETKIASELTAGKPTTLTNPAVENNEDPAIKTNELLGDSKDTLDKILEALKPKDQRNSTNFGLSLFGSPRGFEI